MWQLVWSMMRSSASQLCGNGLYLQQTQPLGLLSSKMVQQPSRPVSISRIAQGNNSQAPTSRQLCTYFCQPFTCCCTLQVTHKNLCRKGGPRPKTSSSAHTTGTPKQRKCSGSVQQQPPQLEHLSITVLRHLHQSVHHGTLSQAAVELDSSCHLAAALSGCSTSAVYQDMASVSWHCAFRSILHALVDQHCIRLE